MLPTVLSITNKLTKMEIDNDFKKWLIKHKNVTVEKFNNLNEVFQDEIMQVYKNEKAVQSIIE